MKIIIIFFQLFAFISFSCSASSSDEAWQAAQTLKLYNNPYWLKLVHYSPSLLTDSKYKSEVISEEFFLSEKGKDSPKDELSATIKALYLPVTEQNKHAQCKFIARYHWLKHHLNLTNIPKANCTDFNEWLELDNIESVSLLFASGYLKNPASFYGHLLLKFNTSNKSALLDKSINYGALMTDNNPILYILNGVFGGYQAGFTDSTFYRQNHNYGQNDLRDLWSYELSLDKTQIAQLAYHLWELMGTKFTYYFLDENCAYHFAKLLSLVIDKPLLDNRTPWVMPLTVFQNLMRDEEDVAKIKLIASRQSEFYQKYTFLSEYQRKAIKQIIETENWADNAIFNELTDQSKIQIINVLFDYIEYQLTLENDPSTQTSAELKLQKKSLVKARFFLPIAQSRVNNYQSLGLSPPHLGQYPKLFRTSLGTTEGETALTFQFRPVYYDILGNETGRMPNSALSMLDLTLRYQQQSLVIQRLDIVSILSYNLARTDLAGDQKYAWLVNFGIDSKSPYCINCNRVQITGGVGKSYELKQDIILNLMSSASLHSQAESEGVITGQLTANLLTKLSPQWHSLLKVSAAIDGQQVHERIRWENSFFNQKSFDVRLKFDLYNQQTSAQLGYSYYF